jgi:hypothetical protein
MMIETYRMLGREHEADLAREAEKWQRSALVQTKERRARPASIARFRALRTAAQVRLTPRGEQA